MDKSTYKCIRMNAEILQIGLQTDRPKNREFNRHVEVWKEKRVGQKKGWTNRELDKHRIERLRNG